MSPLDADPDSLQGNQQDNTISPYLCETCIAWMSPECMTIRSMFGDALKHKDNPDVDLQAAFIEAAGNSIDMENTIPDCTFNKLSYVAARALIKIATKEDLIPLAESLQLNIVAALISGMHPDMIAYNLSKNYLSKSDTTSLDDRQFLLLDIAFADLISRIPSAEDDDTAPLNSKEVLLRSLYDRASLIFNSIRIQSFSSNVRELFYSTARAILRVPSVKEVAKLYEAYSLMINRGLTPENLTTYTNNLISKATTTETFLTQQVLLDIDLIRFNTNLTNQEKLTRIEQLGTSFTSSGVQISTDKYWQRYYVKYKSMAATEPFKKQDERMGN